jgi:hypothetical protein
LGKATLLVLAQIEVKILTAKDNFSCPERATNGSSFQDLENIFFKEELKRRAG